MPRFLGDFPPQQADFIFGHVVQRLITRNSGCQTCTNDFAGKVGEFLVQFPKAFNTLVVLTAEEIAQCVFAFNDGEE